MNIIKAFKLPHTNNVEITFKIKSYEELKQKAIKEENFELASICNDNVVWLNTLIKN